MKIGIIREGKTPPDSRVPLPPVICQELLAKYPFELAVQPSPGRCYRDEEYRDAEINLQEDLSDCDFLMGVKEVPIEMLIPNKTYFFFSHTIKAQAYNRKLLLAIMEKNIRLLDYEVLANDKGQRLIAFGVFAGMVGAHNGIMTYGRRTGLLDLPRMNSMHDYAEATALYKTLNLPPIKVVLTGTGRVGTGAARVLRDMGFKGVNPERFLSEKFEHAVYTQLSCHDYAAPINGGKFDKPEFYAHPERFKSIFKPYTETADVMINGIYWDNNASVFFTREEMTSPDFKIKTIADVTCDIAPVSSIPSTLFASTIADPIFGYDPITNSATEPHQPGVIDMMTVDNLPNELPRDASLSFGQQFLENIAGELEKEHSDILERATVAQNGKLGKHFAYLKDYVEGEL